MNRIEAAWAVLTGRSVMIGLQLEGQFNVVVKPEEKVSFYNNILPYFTINGKPCHEIEAFKDFKKNPEGQNA